MKEQSLLERKAKAHLEDVLRNDLEEKDHLINTLYTKLELLKSNGGKETDDSLSQKENSSENLLIDLSGEANATAQPNSTQNESLSTEAAEAYEGNIFIYGQIIIIRGQTFTLDEKSYWVFVDHGQSLLILS